jgi:hypothetical protein
LAAGAGRVLVCAFQRGEDHRANLARKCALTHRFVNSLFVVGDHEEVEVASKGICPFSTATEEDNLPGNRFELIEERCKACQAKQYLELANYGIGRIYGIQDQFPSLLPPR